jgi:hypothetical protein
MCHEEDFVWRKSVRVLGVWLSVVCVSCIHMGGAWASEGINAVIGDESWVRTHGVAPGDEAGEVERIQTHLRFVIERLERADVSGLSQAQRVNRTRALSGLSEYVEGGEFPRRDAGDGFSGRRPQFIDSRGMHCAVGEMLRRTGHGELAERIDGEHEFSYLPDIDTPGLSRWATDFGFTARELAMIQPAYDIPSVSDLLSLPENLVDQGMYDLIEVCGAPERVPMVFTFVMDPRGPSEGATLRAKSGSAFAECVAEHHEERVREHVAEHYDLFRSGPLEFDVKLGRDDMVSFMQYELDTLDMDWRTTGCMAHQGVSTLVRVLRIAIRSTEDAQVVEVESTPRHESFEACVEAHVQRLYAGFLSSDLGPGSVAARRYVLNDGSKDARSHALLARLLPAEWVPERRDIAAAWLERLMVGLAGLITLIVGAVVFVAWRSSSATTDVETNAAG